VEFVTLGGEAFSMARRHPRAPKVVVSHGKLCEGLLRLRKRASEVRKVVERDPAWSWLLVGNSSYLNRDEGITCGDSKLQQTNHRVHRLVCLLVFSLSNLLE
jgi:hypothetical protein